VKVQKKKKNAIKIMASRLSATDQTSYHMDFGYSLNTKYLQSWRAGACKEKLFLEKRIPSVNVCLKRKI